MKTNLAAAALFACALSAPALAQQTDAKLGDHPAVIVHRKAPQQGYDYASKFYPHPAWLYLSAAPPPSAADAGGTALAGREHARAAHPKQASVERSPSLKSTAAAR